MRSENHAKREQGRPRTSSRGAREPGRYEQGRGAPRSWCSRLPHEQSEWVGWVEEVLQGLLSGGEDLDFYPQRKGHGT